jgi:DNA-directed RNA polymerase specialized sigma24 family protein
MTGEEPITYWLQQLGAGNQDAARHLWQHYFLKLAELARMRLGTVPQRVIDEEDVALSVMRCLCEGAASGRFGGIVNRQELWQLLATITIRKVIDTRRYLNQQKRGGGMVRSESALKGSESQEGGWGLDQLGGEAATPEVLAIATEEFQRLMSLLNDDRLRQLAEFKLEGYKNEEIATKLGLTCRSIERKLQRIRQLWANELPE